MNPIFHSMFIKIFPLSLNSCTGIFKSCLIWNTLYIFMVMRSDLNQHLKILKQMVGKKPIGKGSLHYGVSQTCVCSGGQSCPTLWDPRVACQPPLSWDSPGKITGVACHLLLQGIFPTQESNHVSCISYTDRQILCHHLKVMGIKEILE